MARTTAPDDEFLTVAEVATLLKLNQQTVRNWIDQGTLPAVRIGRRVRIRREDLDRVLAQGSQGSLAPAVPGGPSAADFWSGEAVGAAVVDSAAPAAGTAEAERSATAGPPPAPGSAREPAPRPEPEPAPRQESESESR